MNGVTAAAAAAAAAVAVVVVLVLVAAFVDHFDVRNDSYKLRPTVSMYRELSNSRCITNKVIIHGGPKK